MLLSGLVSHMSVCMPRVLTRFIVLPDQAEKDDAGPRCRHSAKESRDFFRCKTAHTKLTKEVQQ